MSSTTSVEPSLSVTIGGSANKNAIVNLLGCLQEHENFTASKRTPGFYFESRISKAEIFREEI